MRGHDARGARDFVMPMADAKGMLADLTELLLELQTLKEAQLSAKTEEIIEVNLTGGTFK